MSVVVHNYFPPRRARARDMPRMGSGSDDPNFAAGYRMAMNGWPAGAVQSKAGALGAAEAEQMMAGYAAARAKFSQTGRRDAADAYLQAGKTYKQMASELRRSAEADKRGSGRKPLPGRAHGEPDEWSLRSAMQQESMADYFESLGTGKVTEADIAEARRRAGDT